MIRHVAAKTRGFQTMTEDDVLAGLRSMRVFGRSRWNSSHKGWHPTWDYDSVKPPTGGGGNERGRDMAIGDPLIVNATGERVELIECKDDPNLGHIKYPNGKCEWVPTSAVH